MKYRSQPVLVDRVHQPNRWTMIRDDVDLDRLLNEMHLHGSQDPLIFSNQSSTSRYDMPQGIDAARLDGGALEGGALDSGSSSDSALDDGDGLDRSQPISMLGLRDGSVQLPKSLSLPLKQIVTPDPFPELSNSPLTPMASHIQMDSNRSSPTSPMMCRISAKSCPGSREGSPAMPRAWPRSLHSSREDVSWSPSAYTKTMMLFYNDEESYRTLTIDTTMQASDICHLLVVKNHASQDRHWVIVERLSKFNIERSLEDHECVHHIHRSWAGSEDNRFYFRKDFRKYELFKNPAQFFPPHMVDTEQLKGYEPTGIFSHEERYKNILLQHLFNADHISDIHGHLQLKEGKRSWKKHYFVLRTSGLYYSLKGTSKDPRYLTLLVSPGDVAIYLAVNAKKSFGAPTNYCLCLKPPYCVTDPKELTLLCAEDEQSQLCWMTALRLVKYGSQLRENYKAALNYEDRLISIENRRDSVSKKTRKTVHPRVAMDFTEGGGRVVDDPVEALGVAMEEASRWRKKVASRKSAVTPPMSDSPISGPTGILSDSAVVSRYSHGVNAGLHMCQPWFHSGITREEAVMLIKQHGLIDGVFLIRESHSIPGVFVLSLAHNGKVKHCQINKIEEDGVLYFSLDGGHTKFTDLIQLAEFYQLNAGGLPTKLTHYVTTLL